MLRPRSLLQNVWGSLALKGFSRSKLRSFPILINSAFTSWHVGARSPPAQRGALILHGRSSWSRAKTQKGFCSISLAPSEPCAQGEELKPSPKMPEPSFTAVFLHHKARGGLLHSLSPPHASSNAFRSTWNHPRRGARDHPPPPAAPPQFLHAHVPTTTTRRSGRL